MIYTITEDKAQLSIFFFYYFHAFLGAIWPTLVHYREDSLTHSLLLITVFLHILSYCHREPRNKVWFLSPAKRQVGFHAKSFQNGCFHWKKTILVTFWWGLDQTQISLDGLIYFC